MKVQISIDDALAEKIDSYANENYMSRSAFIALCVNQYLSNCEVASAVKSMAISMHKIADTGIVDDETRKKLEDFERISKYLIDG